MAKIVQFTARNIKNLRVVEISPDDLKPVIITGKNGAGKSAVLDSIFSALTGKRLDDPIRHGQDKAEVLINLGEYHVRKVWTPKGERVEVFTFQDGKKVAYSSPQKFLDEQIGKISFDPLEFKNMKPQAQVELLRELTGLDFADIEAEAQAVYAERTALNSKIREAVAFLQNSEAPAPNVPDEEISYSDMLKKINVLREKRRRFTEAATALEEFSEEIGKLITDISEKQNEISKIQSEINVLNGNLEAVKRHIEEQEKNMPEKVGEEQIIAAESEIEDVEKKNAEIRAAIRYRKAVKDSQKLKQKSDEFSETLRRLDQDKITRIQNAQFPLEGLSLSDDAIIFKGTHFSRLSTGEQIKVSASIAMKLNPNLRVIFIRDGSLLDEEGLRAVIELAQAENYEIWIEKICEDPLIGIHLEEGLIKYIDGKEVIQDGKVENGQQEETEEGMGIHNNEGPA